MSTLQIFLILKKREIWIWAKENFTIMYFIFATIILGSIFYHFFKEPQFNAVQNSFISYFVGLAASVILYLVFSIAKCFFEFLLENLKQAKKLKASMGMSITKCQCGGTINYSIKGWSWHSTAHAKCDKCGTTIKLST